MCGIAGVYRAQREHDDIEVVRDMIERLERRGPDGQGLSRDGAITLGHRRLAILDLTEAAHQPMQSACGRYLISYNGEIYNFDDLRREMGLESQDLRSTGDTEILLHAWSRWGEAALDRFVGQWAFAIYDRETRTLWLTRDRFGEKPLFFHATPDRLSFASSIPALFAAPWVDRELDSDALAEYLTLRYVVSPRTVIAGIQKLPPGHLLRASPAGIDVRPWYEPRFEINAGPRRRDRLAEEFGALLTQASERCLVSDVPVALLLSHGIDSNAIRCALSETGREVPSFTYKLTDEASGLQPTGAGERNGDRAMDLLVTPDDRVKHMIPAFGSFTEPVGDGASLATWLLIRNARENATVFLCGHGADEVIGGYRLSQDRFRLALMRRLAWLPEPALRKTLLRFVYNLEPVAARRRALLEAEPSRVPAVTRYLIHRPLPMPDLEEIFYPEPVPGSGESYMTVVDRLYQGCGSEAADLDCMQEVMLRTFLSANILSFADSVAMDASAELRMPFLDRDLVSFVLSLPPGMRVSRWPGRANTKLILRWWGESHMPTEIVTRRKRTFNFGSLRPLMASHGRELRGLLLGSQAMRRALPGLEQWLEHPPEYYRGPWQGTLWALLTLAAWSEQNGAR